MQNVKRKMQNNNVKSKIILFLGSFILCTFVLHFALFTLRLSEAGAAGISLGISPPVIQIDATAPTKIDTPITIENIGDDPVTLSIILKAFTQGEGKNGTVKYYTDKDPLAKPALFQYVTISENDHVKDSVTIAPQQKKVVNMHIGIPKGFPKDDTYFSVIFLSDSEDRKGKETAAQTPAGIATNVLVSVGPKGPTSGEIMNFSAPFFVESGPVPFTVELQNTSDHMITPRGEILIKNMFGQIIGRVDLLPVNILAHTPRQIPDSAQVTEATPSATSKELSEAVAEYLLKRNDPRPVSVWPETFLLGPYTAQLTMALSDQGPVFRRSIYFFALPWTFMVGIIIMIIIATYIIIHVRRKIRQVN